MTVSFTKLTRGAMAYLAENTSADYYTKGSEPEGEFSGIIASKLGLKGTIKKEQYYRIADGYSPDGIAKLRQNAGAKPVTYTDKDGKQRTREPTTGWDITFSAPKSVSVLWATVGDAEREKISLAQEIAVSTAASYIQKQLKVRTGQGGRVSQAAKGTIFASFEHSFRTKG